MFRYRSSQKCIMMCFHWKFDESTLPILFGTNLKLWNGRNLNVSCNGINTESKSLVKYLGASTDNCLHGDLMALSIRKKVNCRLKFLNRNAKFLNRNVRRMLASSSIQCQFDYGCTFWFSASSCKLKSKLQTAQNKLIHFVMGKHSHSCGNFWIQGNQLVACWA